MASKARARRASATATPRPLVFQVTVTEAIHPELYRALKGMSGRRRSMVVQSWADRGRLANLGVLLGVTPPEVATGHASAGIAAGVNPRTDNTATVNGTAGSQAIVRQVLAPIPRTYQDVADVGKELNLFDP